MGTTKAPTVTTAASTVTTAAPTVTTAAPTVTTKAPTVTTTAATVTTTAATAKAASNVFMRYALRTNEDTCKEFLNGNKDCTKDCSGAATFTMSVAFVLVSVIMALHV